MQPKQRLLTSPRIDAMPIDPLHISKEIQAQFGRYLRTAFAFGDEHTDLREQFAAQLNQPGRLFRGPYLHGLAPYVRGESLRDLIGRKVLPPAAAKLPLLASADLPLYRHQVAAIERIRAGRNVVVSSGTGSGKTLTFLAPILSSILEDPQPGVHALLLYPMNALVNDQLKNLRRILSGVPAIRFGRYVNVEVTPNEEAKGRRLNPGAPKNEVVCRDEHRANPPQILITNYAMLEYLLLRSDDCKLFEGPWKFVVVDEAHTYGGTKGGEIGLLMRRLEARVKRTNQQRPQYIATSASLGAEEKSRRKSVLDFANKLFDAPFEDADLIVAETAHTDASGQFTIDPAIYMHPAVMAVCERDAEWTPALSNALMVHGFPANVVRDAAAAKTAEEGLFVAFAEDARMVALREAAAIPRDLHDVARTIFGLADESSLQRLCGLVRIGSLAKQPGGDARLVPCRYHLFARGLVGAYVALAPSVDGAIPTLLLEPARETEDGRKVYIIHACRKCGLPTFHGVLEPDGEYEKLMAREKPEMNSIWLVWRPLEARSDDEADETEELDSSAACESSVHAFDPITGRLRKLESGVPNAEEVVVWKIHEGDGFSKCPSCGGKDSIAKIQASADAAQAVIADAFYRGLPQASGGPFKNEALGHPGRGRKLLTFADNRQSAAYFAPFLQDNNRELILRRLAYRAAMATAKAHEGETDGDTLVQKMAKLTDQEDLFELGMAPGVRLKHCAMALVEEFCTSAGRRQSLEALGLVSCRIALSKQYSPPAELLAVLPEIAAQDLIQVLLGTVRLVKAVEMPESVSALDPNFKYLSGQQAMAADGSERKSGKFGIHGFSPKTQAHRQRRSGYLAKVLGRAPKQANQPELTSEAVLAILDKIWVSLIGGVDPIFKKETLAKGEVGYQLRWDRLRFRTDSEWYLCPDCRQWSAFNVLGSCPSFGCNGTLKAADPNILLADHHYHHTYTAPDAGPVPLVAREHTAQLAPALAAQYQVAFQDGHCAEAASESQQINVLSSSTTFELGVDLGDLEAVFLRNVPPSLANYQQRAGRAGRGVGSSAFAVTFAQARSHDEHYFANPSLMIDGQFQPPRITLDNETIYLRHVTSLLLSEFVRDEAAVGRDIRQVQQFLPTGSEATPADRYLAGLPVAIARNATTISKLVSVGRRDPAILAPLLTENFNKAKEYYYDEVKMYFKTIEEVKVSAAASEANGKIDAAKKQNDYAYRLLKRLEEFRKTDWVNFFSDRVVLPSYAFPIHNVTLETNDANLKLQRDLRIALAEYAPGAAIVANGKLYRSVGVRKPYNGELEWKLFGKCTNCSHVMRDLNKDNVFPNDSCPVCGEPRPRVNRYVVPAHGFTTDLDTNGEKLDFNKPVRLPTSRTLFDPQREADDRVQAPLGDSVASVRVYSSDPADFFVFNGGDEPDGCGFRLCKLCYRQVKMVTTGRGKTKIESVEQHKTPMGRECPGGQPAEGHLPSLPERVFLAHEFRSSAARLRFTGVDRATTGQGFWLSLMYAILGGMTDALHIDHGDIDGVIRPEPEGGGILQEVVIFDNVPGGAGHALRLENRDDLILALEAALDRVQNCPNQCGDDSSCYGCLRHFRNQFLHDQLARGSVRDYLAKLLERIRTEPDADRPYHLSDRASALRTAIASAIWLDLVTDRLDSTGSPEFGPWILHLHQAAVRPGARVRVAIREAGLPTGSTAVAHLVTLAQAGVELFRVADTAPPPPYGLLTLGHDGQPDHRSGAYFWGERRTIAFDAETHFAVLGHNPSRKRITEAATETEAWFASQARPLDLAPIFAGLPDCTVHPFAKGQRVDFRSVVSSLLDRPIILARLQDPYLLTLHQIAELTIFLNHVPWDVSTQPIPFQLITHMTENDPSKKDYLDMVRQKEQLKACLERLPNVLPQVLLRSPKYQPIHMRYAYFKFQCGEERLYLMERGLDIAEPKTRLARNDSYILEFRDIPAELRRLTQAPVG